MPINYPIPPWIHGVTPGEIGQLTARGAEIGEEISRDEANESHQMAQINLEAARMNLSAENSAREMDMEQQKLNQQSQFATMNANIKQEENQRQFLIDQQREEIAKSYHQQQTDLKKQELEQKKEAIAAAAKKGQEALAQRAATVTKLNDISQKLADPTLNTEQKAAFENERKVLLASQDIMIGGKVDPTVFSGKKMSEGEQARLKQAQDKLTFEKAKAEKGADYDKIDYPQLVKEETAARKQLQLADNDPEKTRKAAADLRLIIDARNQIRERQQQPKPPTVAPLKKDEQAKGNSPKEKTDLANRLAKQNPKWTRQQIIDEVNRQLP